MVGGALEGSGGGGQALVHSGDGRSAPTVVAKAAWTLEGCGDGGLWWRDFGSLRWWSVLQR